jgi:predicted RND superfamily exporter protein
MKALTDLFSTDYGLMSVAVIAITIAMGGFYAVWFTRKMNEDAKNANK